MNSFPNFQQQPQRPYHPPRFPQGLPNFNTNPWLPSGNPFCAPPQFTRMPILASSYPTDPRIASYPYLATVRPTNPQFVPQTVYQSLVAKNKISCDQNELLQKQNKELQRQIKELKANPTGKDLKANAASEEAKATLRMTKEELSKQLLQNENLIREKNKMSFKMVELEKEIINLKSKLQTGENVNKELSYKVRTLQKEVEQFKNTLKCHTTDHKKELQSQQQEFNQKLDECGEAFQTEMRHYQDLLNKMNELKKKNIEIQQQLDKTNQEKLKLMFDLRREKEKEQKPTQCECEEEIQGLWKLVRELQKSHDSQAQSTPKRKKEGNMS